VPGAVACGAQRNGRADRGRADGLRPVHVFEWQRFALLRSSSTNRLPASGARSWSSGKDRNHSIISCVGASTEASISATNRSSLLSKRH
jgi:hypothetical protein